VSAFHAYLSVILNSFYFINIGNSFCNLISEVTFSLTIGYFLFDIYYIVRNDKKDILRYMFIYHHLATIYLLFNNHLINNTHQLILVAEISNLPSYPIYYLLHKENKNIEDKISTNILKFTQRVLYFFIRIILMSNILFNLVNELDFNNNQIFFLGIITVPVYFMGIIWTISLLLNN
tara:strand:- start:3689 stop:4219 length:531 start_codon:yes stop_codon:yes gene_type:complete